MSRQCFILIVLCLSMSIAKVEIVHAQATSERSLIVGTKSAPPFAIKNADGSWRGISIELWQTIAKKLNLTYDLREFDLKGLLDGVAQGKLDAAVAALTITAEREERMDFTHPFYTTGLGIAVVTDGKGSWWNLIGQFFSRRFLQVIAILCSLLCAVGLLVWLVERKHNPQQFGGGVAQGIAAGFWWAAVTMTTVGYGDKAPLTPGGRIIGLIWMFAGIIMISGFTAAITTALTVTQLSNAVQGPEDLARVRVGTVQASSSEAYLRNQRRAYLTYPNLHVGLQALSHKVIDAMVYDAPLLRYLAITDFKGMIEVLPVTFERQDYGIALQAGSVLRESINRVLLETINSDAWQDVLYRYLGHQ
jgi:polar amino acid transport system substrate-binding protein